MKKKDFNYEEFEKKALEAIYPIIWMDAIRFKVKEENRIKTKVVYCIIGDRN